jgi:hypothetical protein
VFRFQIGLLFTITFGYSNKAQYTVRTVMFLPCLPVVWATRRTAFKKLKRSNKKSEEKEGYNYTGNRYKNIILIIGDESTVYSIPGRYCSIALSKKLYRYEENVFEFDDG